MYCGCKESKVIDSRASEDGETIRRRRECIACGKRFTTYETVETTPITEIYRAVRRSIANNRSIQTASFKYVYIEDLSTDEDGETTDTFYHRIDKYSSLATEPCYDINDNISRPFAPIASDIETMKTVDQYITDMNLTTRQATILKYRMRGYGYQAIATYLGVSKQAIAKTVYQIQAKAKAIGLDVKTEEKDGVKQ